MAKGLSRRSGPPPDPDSLTQTDGDWTVLPAEGRKGPVPEWPLSSPTGRELELWAGEWCRPQAVMWEQAGQELEVALFVRSLVKAEAHEASTNARTLVRQQMEALGISVPGMQRNRWKIGQIEPVDADVEPDDDDVRNRLTVVAGGAA